MTVVTIFRSRLRDTHEGYDETADEMEAAARAMPGFVDFKTFRADDGERVSLVVFDSRDAHEAWRDDPRHQAAQQRGREEWYAEYHIQVCSMEYEYSFRH
ncbi:MAG TPA: antibiotic biosynthesis monooxygenase [Acidimicrobiales bacterium]|nr:antibiotic biosynthesis monooxygenase [Acidimicrobiales bacterium]